MTNEFQLLTADTPYIYQKDRDFIKFCKPYYKMICCLMSDPECEKSISWEKHSVNIVSSCVFVEPNSSKKGRIDGWPAIWKAVDKV